MTFDIFTRLISELQNRVERIEKGLFIKKITIPSDDTGYFVPKVVTSDPSSPANNEIWIRSDLNQLRWNKSGTIKSVTLT